MKSFRKKLQTEHERSSIHPFEDFGMKIEREKEREKEGEKERGRRCTLAMQRKEEKKSFQR